MLGYVCEFQSNNVWFLLFTFSEVLRVRLDLTLFRKQFVADAYKIYPLAFLLRMHCFCKLLILFSLASTRLSFVSGVDGTRQHGSRLHECLFRTCPLISAAADEGDATAAALHVPHSFGTLYSAESLAASRAGETQHGAKLLSGNSLSTTVTGTGVGAFLTSRESLVGARGSSVPVYHGDMSVWRDHKNSAQSLPTSQQIFKTAEDTAAPVENFNTFQGEGKHLKLGSGPSHGQSEISKCTKTLHHKSIYVPGTFVPGKFFPGVKVPQTPPAFIPGTPGFWEPGRSPYYTPGFWTPGYSPRYVSAIPATILPGKKATVIPGDFFPPAYSPGYLIPGWYETISCANSLCSMSTC